jgi:hypothetical protein
VPFSPFLAPFSPILGEKRPKMPFSGADWPKISEKSPKSRGKGVRAEILSS